MDLEKLTKHQIILLTLLVSFVTSIATGIVTVSLMQQAPPFVSRTINQIVEHTVQTIAPTTQGAAAITTQKTIVVKDEDLVAQSIATLQKSIIRITAAGGNDLVARGVIIDAKGTALTDKAALENSGSSSFEAILPDGTRAPVTVIPTATTTAFSLLSVSVGTSTAFVPAVMADASKVRLGESVIRIGGKGVDAVGEGVVAMMPGTASDILEASVQASTPGSILATHFGEIVAMTTSSSLSQGADLYTILTLPAAQSEPKTLTKP